MAYGSPLASEMEHDGPSIYYDETFRNMIEFHLDWLRTRVSTVTAQVPGNLLLRHEYNFYGLLYELKIPAHLHWIILRLNGLTDPHEYRSHMTQIYIPDNADINTLRTTFSTVHKIR